MSIGSIFHGIKTRIMGNDPIKMEQRIILILGGTSMSGGPLKALLENSGFKFLNYSDFIRQMENIPSIEMYYSGDNKEAFRRKQ